MERNWNELAISELVENELYDSVEVDGDTKTVRVTVSDSANSDVADDFDEDDDMGVEAPSPQEGDNETWGTCVNKHDSLLSVVQRGDEEKADELVRRAKAGKIIRII